MSDVLATNLMSTGLLYIWWWQGWCIWKPVLKKFESHHCS